MHGTDLFHGWGTAYGPLFVILLVAILFWIWRGGGTAPRRRSKRSIDDPLEILDQRFARGEINEEEYLRRRSTLKAQARSSFSE